MKKFFTLLIALMMAAVPAVIFTQDAAQNQPAQPAPAQPAPDQPAQDQQTPPAQDQPPAQEQQQAQVQQNQGLPENLVRLNDFQDMSITGANGDNNGDIEDVVLTADGKVSHIIADLENVPQVESGRYLVPFEAVQITQMQQGAMGSGADTTGTGAAGTPGATTDTTGTGAAGTPGPATGTADVALPPTDVVQLNISNVSDLELLAEGVRPSKIARDSILLSSLADYQLIDGQQQELDGSLEDVVVDKETGEVAYVAFSFGGTLGVGAKLEAVPYQDVWYNLTNRTVQLNVSQDQIEQLEGFESDQWPSEPDPNWEAAAPGPSLGSGQQTEAPAATPPAEPVTPPAEPAAEPAPETTGSGDPAATPEADTTTDQGDAAAGDTTVVPPTEGEAGATGQGTTTTP